MKVAIVGAPQTGKTKLTHALSARLNAQGLVVEIVDAACIDSISTMDLVLLCGLDLGHITPAQIDIDQKIRNTLQQAALNFQVVYGTGEQRLDNALYCLGRQAPQWTKQLERPESPPRWSGPCETCGDGDCEHRLFTRLVKT
jgi:nicotinamide riboside kinase